MLMLNLVPPALPGNKFAGHISPFMRNPTDFLCKATGGLETERPKRAIIRYRRKRSPNAQSHKVVSTMGIACPHLRAMRAGGIWFLLCRP
jgi:hypothetical protein